MARWMALLVVLAAMAGIPVSQAEPPRVPVAAARSTSPTTIPSPPVEVSPRLLHADLVAAGFDRPVEAVVAPGSRSIYVAEKAGTIRVLSEDGSVAAEPFLDLTAIVDSEGVEQGLLGLAFHPDYPSNGRLFVHYTGLDGDVEIVEYHRSVEGDLESVEPVDLVLRVEQPQEYHNGGTLRFGPDGYLYIGLGDGGGIGDEFGNGQDTYSLLGSILRLDIDAAAPYAVPETNPFAEEGGAPEIWIYGLRNPWRFFIDPVERQIVIGDVGQFAIEEVDVLSLDSAVGSNLGWPIVEGDTCFAESLCRPEEFVGPVFTYHHDRGCAVQGGPVYWGEAIPWLRGAIVYGDFCGGWVASFRLEDGQVVDWTQLIRHRGFEGIYSFALDADGEVLVLTTTGEIYRLEP